MCATADYSGLSRAELERLAVLKSQAIRLLREEIGRLKAELELLNPGLVYRDGLLIPRSWLVDDKGCGHER
jgi:hypothetical protein